ncbi:MAG: hypothetical protein ACOC44_20725 [Promethearchaeia archaeon]
MEANNNLEDKNDLIEWKRENSRLIWEHNNTFLVKWVEKFYRNRRDVY